MTIDSEQNKTQKKLIVLAILVLMTTLGVLYFGYFKREQPGAVDTAPDILKGARELRLDLELLESERFKNFVPYSKLPTDIETGRDNPFAPYD